MPVHAGRPSAFWRAVPSLLIALRVILGPITFLTLSHHRSGWAALLYLAALLSDIYDGVIARRYQMATPRLRIADSYADIFFYGWLGLGIIVGFRELLTSLALPFFLSLGFIAVSWMISLLKFGRITSYHSLAMKISGLGLFTGIVVLLLVHNTGPLAVSLWWLTAAAVEEFLMTLLLPDYHCDVWNLAAAWRLRDCARKDKVGA